MRRKKRKRTREKKHTLTKMIFFILVFTLLAATILSIDKKLFPTVLTVADIQARNIVNEIIYQSVSDIVAENNINSSDFYVMSSNEDGFVNSFVVNTVLVNEICGKIGADLSSSLTSLGKHKIRVPLGVLLGMDILAGFGPEYTVSLVHMGHVDVDYETKFESVGINQINFQVWVHVDTQIQIVNPLQKSTETVSRKIALVDTVLSGNVPESFISNVPVTIPVN